MKKAFVVGIAGGSASWKSTFSDTLEKRLEGLLTLWDKDICSRLDLKLFVDCKPDERIVRRLRRNMQWGLTFDQISEVYLDLVRYRHNETVSVTFFIPKRWDNFHPSLFPLY